jgi:Zn-finger nucleic acid-binding protein
MILYPCQHIYHANCLVTDWCPQCRNLWSYVDGKVEYTKLIEEKGRIGNQKKKEKMAKLREWDLSM